MSLTTGWQHVSSRTCLSDPAVYRHTEPISLSNLSNKTPRGSCDSAGLRRSSSPRCRLTAATAGGHRATGHHSPPHTQRLKPHKGVTEPAEARATVRMLADDLADDLAGSVTASPANASCELVSTLGKTHENSMNIMRMSNMTLSVLWSCNRRGRCRTVGDTCWESQSPLNQRGHTLTLEAELRVFMAPEFLRLAVKRPQIRDVAMSPSRAE